MREWRTASTRGHLQPSFSYQSLDRPTNTKVHTQPPAPVKAMTSWCHLVGQNAARIAQRQQASSTHVSLSESEDGGNLVSEALFGLQHRGFGAHTLCGRCRRRWEEGTCLAAVRRPTSSAPASPAPVWRPRRGCAGPRGSKAVGLGHLG